MKKVFGICAVAMMGLTIFAASIGAQQDKSARPSPPAKAECKIADGKTVTIDYSSPRMKGRKIFGDLVPYGKIWRAGANEATTFVTTGDLTIGGNGLWPAATQFLQFQTLTSGRSSSARKPASGARRTRVRQMISRAWA